MSNNMSKVTQLMEAGQHPYITIIIPIYNCEHFLADCIKCIKRQTIPNLEIICVDDCSTDNSLDVLRKEILSDPRFQVIALDKNAGQGHARNIALNLAKGEYIQFLDADDYVLDNCCEALYGTAKKLNLDILMYSGRNFFEKEKPVVNPYWEYAFLPSDFKHVFNYKDCGGFIQNLPVSNGINFYKRELLNKNDIRFPEGLYFEDKMFFLKALFIADRVSILNEKLYMRRKHEQSTTQNWTMHLPDYIKVASLLMDYMNSSGIPKSFSSAICRHNMEVILDIYERMSQSKQREILHIIKDFAEKYKISDTILSLYPKFGVVRRRGEFRQFRLFGVPIVELGYANCNRTFILRLLGKKIYKKTKK